MLRLYDTARRELIQLTPGTPEQVTVYVCGPTVYDDPHLGHGRLAVVFDTLRRTLERLVAPVRFVSNITDIDDKIVDRAAREGVTPPAIAERYESRWWDAIDALGVRRPTVAPHASEWLDAMVALIERLVDRGHAYMTKNGVYLSVDHVPDYGLLKHQALEELRAGARVEVDDAKRSPLDFALWKTVESDAYGFATSLGYGRPGWHTECVAMSTELLGSTFDLHGGGMDLVFPHHENERAQASLLDMGFAQHWVHNAFVELEGEKMSKSLGNTFGLHDAIASAGGRVVRLAYLRAHYRSPVELTTTTLEQAAAQLARLDSQAGAGDARAAEPADLEEFDAALADDLDTPAALAVMAEAARAARSAALAGESALANRRRAALAAMLETLGLPVPPRASIPSEVTALVAERDHAKRDRDFARADALRAEIAALGYQVRDTPNGPEILPA
ncbi:cysteinyl-tRNA synthetase [Acidimicrobium ferrooxidans DSM 10331]|uniref:Cysteine--tRNA ligase n=1 Tax=Acidimicrobium ferrooxidans (strain DSM 10331 / JCM 15462 / NBRC 103882 / ICP) TaxID=525909 RepID=C7M2N0_ACIFD|nr:cysteine--tRNA ligase [Acidimicrobium ferrooxidans]ACU53274.1 cysteinyl-tRNA synthetase [Acidimicrobium ferrooxidans DSM 10331]